MRQSAGRRCLVCDEALPKKTRYRSVFGNSSDMDDVDRGLSERLEIIFDTKLNQDQIHSTEICHLCEAKAVQIEDYFRLLLVFRETFKQTARKYGQWHLCTRKSAKSKKKYTKNTGKINQQTSSPKKMREKSSKVEKTHFPEKDAPVVKKRKLEQIPEILPSSHTTDNLDQKEKPIDSSIGESGPEAQELHKSEKIVLSGKDTTVLNKDVRNKISASNDQLITCQSSNHKGEVKAPVSDNGQQSGPLKQNNINETLQPPNIFVKRFVGKRKFKCITCSKVFANMRNLKRHQVNHSRENETAKFECPACDLKFTRTNSLISHIELHKQSGINMVLCGHCSKPYLSIEECKNHEDHECQKQKKHKCSQCSCTFRCKSELTNHEMVHTGSKPFRCSICEKCFSRKQILREHSRIHSTERSYKCDKCDASFRFRSGLRFHRNKAHSDERPHKCSLCDKTFSVITNLRTHMRLHTGEKPYLCPECGRGFAQSSSLQVHLATHSTDHPYKCASCEKAFKRRSYLRRHTLTHTKDQPYACPKCEMAYCDKRSLDNHLLSHTGAKPHACSTCGKKFQSKISLKDHECLHTKQKSHRCELCGKTFAIARYLRKHIRVHAKADSKLKDKDLEKSVKENDSNGMEVMKDEQDSVITEQEENLKRIEPEKNTSAEESASTVITNHGSTSVLPLNLHQTENENHFNSESQFNEPLFCEFKSLQSSFPSPVNPKPHCLAMSTDSSTHDFHYQCPGVSDMTASLDIVNDNRTLTYQSIPSNVHHTALPHMSEVYNETLNLKMVKYNNDFSTREFILKATPDNLNPCHEEEVYHSMSAVQSHDHLGTGSGNMAETGMAHGGFLYPSLMLPAHGAFLGQRHNVEQTLPNLYTRHPLDHGQEQGYHLEH